MYFKAGYLSANGLFLANKRLGNNLQRYGSYPKKTFGLHLLTLKVLK